MVGAGLAKLHGQGHDAGKKKKKKGRIRAGAAVYPGLYAKIPYNFWKDDLRFSPVFRHDPHPPDFKNLLYLLILEFRIYTDLILMSLKPRVKPGAQ